MKRKINPDPPIGKVIQKSKGEIPYDLPRLEFLELRLNSIWSNAPRPRLQDIGVVFRSRPRDDTITIHIYYPMGTNRQLIDGILRMAKKIVSNEAELLGWDWVKIEMSTQTL